MGEMEYRISKNSEVHKENKHPSLEATVMLQFSMGSMKLIAGGKQRTNLICNFKSPSCSHTHYLYSSADSTPTEQQEGEHWYVRQYKTVDDRMLKFPQRFFGPFSIP